MELQEVWQNTLGELEVLLTKANFKTWFKDTQLTTVDNGQAIIGVPSIFIQSWLEKKYHSAILKTLKKQLPAVKSLKYAIITKKPVPEKILFEKPTNKSEKTEEISSPENHGLTPHYIFETFVIGSSNRLAFATSQAVSENPGATHNPLFIYGGVGLGKTHLMQAIGNQIKKNNPKTKILYVSCEDFANEYINAIKSQTMDKFKNKYRRADIFLIDDIQFLSKKEGTQEEFFHTFNTLYQTNRQIVMTSDRVPKAIPALEERLSSRMGCGMIVDISPPDFETRLAILELRCERTNKNIENKVLEYIAQNIPSSIRELEGAFNKVVTDAQLLNQPITLEQAEHSLKDLIDQEQTRLTPEKIINTICLVFNLNKEELYSKKRSQNLVFPRQIAMYLIRQMLKTSYPKIGDFLGGKDHTTIIHGVDSIEKKLAKDVDLQKQIEEIKTKIIN